MDVKQGEGMSTTTFVEATSADPVIRDLHRRAVRVLNDPSLDRQQREFHVRRLQSMLLEHQAKEAAKGAKLAAKTAKREQVSRANRNQRVADPSQIVARRKEFGAPVMEQGIAKEKTAPLVEITPQAIRSLIAANDSQVPGRNRPVLSLKKA
jgi:hypothetical protein